MKLFLLGVFGLSLKTSVWLERVWRGGGGTGRILSCFPPAKRLVTKFDIVMVVVSGMGCR